MSVEFIEGSKSTGLEKIIFLKGQGTCFDPESFRDQNNPVLLIVELKEILNLRLF